MKLIHGISVIGLGILGAGPLLAANIVIVNADGPGEGFNDTTPASPVGGNTGVTLGEQRLQAFQYAAQIWADRLDSPVEIKVEAKFDPLSCNQSSAVLGSAGTTTLHRDFNNAPQPATWYPQALANALAGSDLSASSPDLSATFNSAIDNNNNCLNGTNWYLGLDGDNGGDIDLVDVVIHEIGHGLGFASYVDESTGSLFLSHIDVFSTMLEDHSTMLTWEQMTNAERQASAIDSGDLHFIGSNVTLALGAHAPMYAPNPVQPGSSVSHWSTSFSPDELMEPFITQPPIHDPGLALELMLDLGWQPLVPGNQIPDVVIASPADGAVFDEGQNITFTASAFDAEDGDLSSGISWQSSLDGVLGVGASVNSDQLSVGSHVITASVSDSASASGSDLVSLTIEAVAVSVPTAPSGVSMADQGDGSVVITWQDNSHNESQFDILRESPHKRRPNAWVGSTVVGAVGPDVVTYTDSPGAGNYRYCVSAINAGGASDWVCSAVTEVTDSAGDGGDGGGGSFCDSRPNHKRCR